jgi:hypothetical protein
MQLNESKNRHTSKILTVTSVHSRDIKRAPGHDIRHFCDSSATTLQLRCERTPGKLFTFILSVLALLIALITAPTVMLAGGGNVLPGPAKPKGYSLSDMAKATAFFNTGSHDLTFYPDTPFQILYIPPGTPADTSPSFEVRPAPCYTCRSSTLMTRRPSPGTSQMLISGKQSYTTFIPRRSSARSTCKSWLTAR